MALLGGINDNDCIELIDLDRNYMNMKYRELIDKTCKKNRDRKIKDIIPSYKKALD